MTATDVELDAAVTRGAALLDERGPANWRELLNRETLNLYSTRTCVVGQVFATPSSQGDDAWHDGLAQLNAPSSYSAERRSWIAEHGFDINYYGVINLDVAFEQLTDAWRRHLARERQEVS